MFTTKLAFQSQSEVPNLFFFSLCRTSQSTTEPDLAGPEQELSAAHLGDASEKRRQHHHRLHHRTLRGGNQQVAPLQRTPLPRSLLQGAG